jgi:class 3 adenylate cyclase/tetratricopeptide (TPR) repeat protein
VQTAPITGHVPAPEPLSSPAARAGDPEEWRPVTVLFADIVGFTSLSERLDAETVREITTECFRQLVPEVTRYEGTIDKFMGDAVMALFGAPTTHEDDPARALWAALAMQRALERFNAELERARGMRLALRIGIESGDVVAGVRDVAGVREYTVIGDAVNVAARLQAATEPSTILVGAATERRSGGGFAFRSVPPLVLKGKDQPVNAFVLLGPSDPSEPERLAPAGVSRAPLVGRADELRSLEECLTELRRGRGQIVLVLGEPGLGKSRLLTELRSRAGGVSWVRAQAFAHEGAVSYGLARTLVRELCGMQDDEPEAAAAQRLRTRLAALGCPTAYPPLALLLTLPLDGEASTQVAGLAPEELQRLTFGAVAELLARLAADAPLVIELDDLHWADPSSVDLLISLLHLAERAPILFCYALRPERDAPAWALRERAARDVPHRHTELLLRPLSETASTELVAELLGLAEPPPGLRSVLERAAGTPLWVEELVSTLIERGLLVAEDGQWRVTADLDRVEIPNTLHALLVARIDRLGDARPTLQTAAVIGRQFGQRVLERVAGEGASLSDHLLVAQRVDLVRELQAVPEREYGFKHVLTQEAAYATLLLRRRRELHRQVAEALEELYPERVDELHAILAYHYQRAEAWDRAYAHARLAADAARAAYANREAIEQYGRALDAAERAGLGPEVRASLHQARAQVYEVLGEFEPSRQAYELALALAEESGDLFAQAGLLGALGSLWGGHKDYRRGLELTRQAVAVAERTGDRRLLAEARTRVGLMQLNLAQMTDSLRELQGALALFRELGDESGQASSLDILCVASMIAGDLDQAVAYGREAIPLLTALGERWTTASSTANLGGALAFQGIADESEALAREAIAVWTEIGARSGEAYGHLCIGFFMHPFGSFERALHEAQIGLQIAREIDHNEWRALGLGVVGQIRRACGDVAGARRLHEEMLDIARELGANIWLTAALCELGQDLAWDGDEADALRLLDEAMVAGGDALEYTAMVILAQAELPLRYGRPEEALTNARRVLAEAPQFRVLAADAARIEGEALAALGRLEEAEAGLRRAKAAAVEIGTDPIHWRSCLGLGDLFRRSDRPDAAGTEFAEALALLEAMASTLSDVDLRRAFEDSEPMRRARAGLQAR